MFASESMFRDSLLAIRYVCIAALSSLLPVYFVYAFGVGFVVVVPRCCVASG